MRKNLKSFFAGALSVIILFVNFFLPSSGASANTDFDEGKAHLLDPMNIIITQDGKEVQEGESIEVDKSIKVQVDFRVPVEGDEGFDEFIQYGDKAILKIGKGVILSSEDSVDLIAKDGDKEIKIGTVYFKQDPEFGMIAEIVFDGDESVFNEDSYDVNAGFEVYFDINEEEVVTPSEDDVITILGKTFKVSSKPQDLVYEMEKTGEKIDDEPIIEWTIEVSAQEGKNIKDLVNHLFKDDLSKVGEYIEGSFTVNGDEKTPDISGSVISYTFPDGSDGVQVIKFKTRIPDGKYYGNTSSETIRNTAELHDDEGKVTDSDGRVTFSPPEWIDKDGSLSEDENGRIITWDVTVNEECYELNGVVITDDLQDGLEFVSATYSLWDADNGTWGEEIDIDRKGSQYDLGNINTKARLTIVTKVSDEVIGEESFKNTASVDWDDLPSGVTPEAEKTVVVGKGAIIKAGTLDTKNRNITWTVNVDVSKLDSSKVKVYDLLIYDTSTKINTVSVDGIDVKKLNITPQYNQKYIEGSFDGGTLELKVHSVTKNGVEVGQLLEVTNFSNSLDSFNFKTEILGEKNLIESGKTTIYNTADLFVGDRKHSFSTAKIEYMSNPIKKNMLLNSYDPTEDNWVNNYTTDPKSGYDYRDDSVIFRIAVNTNGYDYSNINDTKAESLGKVVVYDTLPDGWEFDKFESGKEYLVFPGKVGSINASSNDPVDVEGLDVKIDGKTITFKFTNLDKPYVILVKARPNEETAKEYFTSGKSFTVRNTAYFTTENGKTTENSRQDVTLNGEILTKSIEDMSGGELCWTVDYNPHGTPEMGDKIEDIIPVGIELRLNADGTLNLEDENIVIYELKLSNDGYTIERQLTTEEIEKCVSYDTVKRKFVVEFPDSKKAYRVTYMTDVTDDVEHVTNKVTLYSKGEAQVEVTYKHSISDSSGWANLKRKGQMEIEKVDEKDKPLQGAKFAIFAKSNGVLIREAETDEDGKIEFKLLPIGEYTFKETVAPNGYVLDETVHTLVIKEVNGKAVSSIDGKEGEDSYKIVIKNFPKLETPTPSPSATPEPSITPEPSQTPDPSATPGPSITPAPTATPKPTPTPEIKIVNLTIKKMVEGDLGDKTRRFTFVVEFDAEGSYSYTGSKKGTIKSGDEIRLAHGESITIHDLPYGTTYKVTEKEANQNGYKTKVGGTSGKIDGAKVATFVNTKSQTPKTGDNSQIILPMIIFFISALSIRIILRKEQNAYVPKR